jgi:phosphate transport system substrate-binding protein
VHKWLAIFCFCGLLLTLGCGGGLSKTAPEVKITPPAESLNKFSIAGSGANIPVTTKLAQAYQSKTGVAIEIPGSIGSDGAINAVKAGELELGLISRPLTDADRAVGLKELPYARIGVVFASHRDVADSDVSTQDVLAILSGTKTAWSDGSKIYVFVRQANDSSNLIFYSLITDYKAVLSEAAEKRRWQVFYRDGDMAGALRKTKGSFGLTNLTEIAQSDSEIKPLALDGIAATSDNIVNGSYKPVVTLSFIYKSELTSRAAKFVEFVTSDEGRQVLAKWGAAPLGR